MKKRILYLVLVLVLLCAIVPQMTTQAHAEIITGQCGKNGNNLTWELDTYTGLLQIKGTGDMATYGDDAPWKAYRGSITGLKIASGVTSIGPWAFYDCYALEGAEIPDSVTSIGDRAFYGCASLRDLTIGSGVTYIGQMAFEGCYGLQTVSLDMKYIDNWFQLKNFNTLILGSHVETIEEYAFYNCTGLNRVVMGKAVKEIGGHAFDGCTAIERVDFTDRTAWCAIAFANETANPLYYATNMYLNDTLVEDLSIPSTVTKIGNYAFVNYPSLKSVSIASSVKTIGTKAFSSCRNLKTVTLRSGLTTIEAGAFSDCPSITTLKTPDSLTSIGESAFENCTGLSDVDLGSGLTEIGKAAFKNCTSIHNIVIPDAVTKIGASAFQDCKAMTIITMPASLTESGIDAFLNCTALGRVNINDVVTWCQVDFKVTTAEANANSCPSNPLYYGRNLYLVDVRIDTLTIPGSVTKIKDFAFINSIIVQEIDIQNGVVEIGRSAFSGSSPKKVVIPDSVTKLGNYAFMGCSNLEEVSIGKNVTDIGVSAFKQSAIKKIVIPKGVKTIKLNTFSGCKSLKDVYLPKGVSKIEASAFVNCYALYSISLPNTVMTIGANAFGYCTKLEHVCFDGLADEWKLIDFTTGNEELTVTTGTKANKFHWEVNTTLAAHAKLEVHAAPTCTLSGSDRLACDCGYVWTQNREDQPALGHNFVEGLCTRCGAADPNYTKIKFTDVPIGSWFRAPVIWAVKKGITEGTSKTTFSPDQKCTRGQVVTFLWRAMGKPAPKYTTNPFKDIKVKDYYYTAILWAYHSGLTAGRTETTFAPGYTCPRAQVVTFLWRLAGSPIVSVANPFSDVKPSHYFYQPVLWAISKDITQGMSSTKFSPYTTCTRAQVVTFLYRYFVLSN